jgi:hypothetical protein
VDLRCRMLTDTLEHIDEVVVGIDIVQAARDEKALHDADLSGAKFGPCEHPILAGMWISTYPQKLDYSQIYWRNQLSYNGVVGKHRGAANAGELCHGLFEHGT